MSQDEPLPHWAVGLATDYMEPGAALPTRDGRVMGNATVMRVQQHEKLGPVATIRTDAGNTADLTRRELAAHFWPPVWRKDIGPRTEHPDDTRARAMVSLDTALARQEQLTPAHRVILRDMMLPAWQEWAGTMQTARLDQADPHHVRVAALFLVANVFWETVVMTTDPTRVSPVAERLLGQLVGIIREGPGR